MQKKIADDKSYYLFFNGKILLVKSDKASFLEILEDKNNELETYLKANKINFKNEEELIAFIDVYNNL